MVFIDNRVTCHPSLNLYSPLQEIYSFRFVFFAKQIFLNNSKLVPCPYLGTFPRPVLPIFPDLCMDTNRVGKVCYFWFGFLIASQTPTRAITTPNAVPNCCFQPMPSSTWLPIPIASAANETTAITTPRATNTKPIVLVDISSSFRLIRILPEKMTNNNKLTNNNPPYHFQC